MRAVLNICRILVGTLFIFSGLVKANDPLGLSYKMKEFFEIWNLDLSHSSFFLKNFLINLFEFLHEHSLTLSVIMITFEIVAGVALLIGWSLRLFGWLLLLLILFFTFLTGYAFYSGKFTNCGCFGDCIPISPKASFLKDIALTVLIIFIFRNRKKIHSSLKNASNLLIIVFAIAASLGLQWYVLNYLPIADCLPFKPGNNIPEKMKPPAGSKPDSFAIRFIYEKNGKQYEFSANELPKDLNTYTFKNRIDKLIRKGNADPPIKGFSLQTASGADSTEQVLAEPYCFLLFSEDISSHLNEWRNKFDELKKLAKIKNVPVYMVTSSISQAQKIMNDVPVFECDFTVIRTAARTNPCLYLLKQGTIVNKWSYKNFGRAVQQLSSINSQPGPAN